MKKYSIVLFVLLAAASWAQSPKRVEIQARAKAENMHIVPVEAEGVVLFSEADKGRYVFTRYNTDLQQDWSFDMTVNPALDLTRYIYRNKALYLLFSRYKTPVYQVVRVNVRAGFAAKYEFNSLDKLDIIDFDAIDNDIFLAGKTRNEPVLLRVNLTERQTKVLPTAFRVRTDIQSIEADSLHGVINAVFVTSKGRQKTVFVKTYAPTGEVLASATLNADPKLKYELLGGRVSNLADTGQQLGGQQQLVIGTYGTQGPVYSRASTYNAWGWGQGSVYTGTADYSQGLYITKLHDGKAQFSKYHSFTDFKNFFTFLSGRQQEKMAARIQKQKERGKDLRLQYRLLVHDIIQRNGQYIMVAEAYYPQYRNNNNFGGNPMFGGFGMGGFGMGGFGIGFGNPWGYGPYSGYRNYPVFDGYVYTHAVIAGFDMQGNLLWDNSFEINDVKTFVLKEKVKVNVEPDQVTLAYNQGGKLRTKVIRGNQVLEGKEAVELAKEFEGDKVRKSLTDDVEYWYGNHFLAWGYQRITNDENTQARGRRNVFYLEKVDL